MSLLPPLISFDTITRAELNACLLAWGHRMGPIQRPAFASPIDFVLRLNDEPIAVVAADTLIRDTCGFTRASAFELSRMCAAPGHRGVSSLMMRQWRAFAYPLIVRAWGTPWVISYQDAVLHSGNLYRFDGWVRLGCTSSGTDARASCGCRKGRKKIIWGWTHDAPARAAARAAASDIQWPRWANVAVA